MTSDSMTAQRVSEYIRKDFKDQDRPDGHIYSVSEISKSVDVYNPRVGNKNVQHDIRDRLLKSGLGMEYFKNFQRYYFRVRRVAGD